MPAKGKKKVRRLRPYEKMQEFSEKYKRICAKYDVPFLDQVDELYDPLIEKRSRKMPPLMQFAEDPIDSIQLAPLIEALQTSEVRVKFFSFLNTGTGDDGLHALAAALRPPLEVVGIAYHNNDVGPSGCRGFARAMVRSQFLVILELDFNPGIGDEGVAGLCHYGHCPTLSKLSLRFCGIKDDGAEALARWIAMPECKVKDLLLNGNEIGPRGAIALGKALAENNSLNFLDLSDNIFGFDPNALQALHDGIKASPTITGVSLLNNFECPEGFDELFLKLVEEKPLGDFVLTTKMDGTIFQNIRAFAMINKRKIAKEAKRKRLESNQAAKAAAAAAKEGAPVEETQPQPQAPVETPQK